MSDPRYLGLSCVLEDVVYVCWGIVLAELIEAVVEVFREVLSKFEGDVLSRVLGASIVS